MKEERKVISIRESDKEFLAKLAQERGVPLYSVLDEALDFYRRHHLTETGKSDERYIHREDLEEQAKNLIRSLFQPSDADLSFELCERQYKVPAHMMLAGILLHARE